MKDESEQKTTTAQEFAESLESYVDRLSDFHQRFESEKKDIRQGLSEIQEERRGLAADFIHAELKSIDDPSFDRFNKLSENVPELCAQSLGFTRNKLLNNREEALDFFAKENDDKPVTIQQAHQIVKESQERLAATRQDAKQFRERNQNAQRAWIDWQEESASLLVRAEKSIISRGGEPLDEQRHYYDPQNIFVKAWRSIFGNDDYQRVRDALIQVGHGKGDKDAFAKLPAWRKKDRILKKDTQRYEEDLSRLEETAASQKDVSVKYSKVAEDILTDGQILEKLRSKALDFFEEKAFVDAAVQEYGDRFPQRLPLLLAKTQILGKLAEGVETKQEVLWDQRKTAKKAFEKVDKVRRRNSSQKIKFDLDTFNKQKDESLSSFEQIGTAATRSRMNAMNFSSSSAVPQNTSSFGFFEGMMLMHILSPSTAGASEMSGLTEALTSSQSLDTALSETSTAMTASLLGIDSGKATDLGLSDTLVSSIPDFSSTFERNTNCGFDTAVSDSVLNSDVFKTLDSVSSSLSSYDSSSSWSSSSYDSGSSSSFSSDCGSSSCGCDSF